MIRVCLAAVAAAAFVALSGVASVADDDKKKDDPYTHTVTYRQWVKGEKKFLKPREGVKAFPSKGKDGQDKWNLRSNDIPNVVTEGSEIIDPDGKVWVVTKAVNAGMVGGDWVCYVKPAPEKPA
jgi:hypothetical protein